MLKSEPMQKVRIICLETDKGSVVAALHKLGMLELKKSSLEIKDDMPQEYSSEISEMLIKTDGAIQFLKPQPLKKEAHLPMERLFQISRERIRIADKVYSLVETRKQIKEDQTLSDYAGSIAEMFLGTGIHFNKLKSDVLDYRAFTGSRKEIGILEDTVKKLRLDHEFVLKEIGKQSAMLFIAFEKDKSIDEAVKNVKVTELDLGARYLDGTPEEIVRETQEARARNQKRLGDIENELAQISMNHYSSLVNLKEILEIEQSRAEASALFKRTDKTCVIEGWVPVKREADLKAALDSSSSGRYNLENLKTGHDELAPTYLNRPKFLKPFDFLMNFYSTPRSDEIDPTWIFIISFPIFYGLMLSDVGYGILSFLFVTWVTRKTNPEGLVYNTAKVWQLTSVAAIFFGVLSNQYFGIGLNQYFIPGATQFNWFTNVTSLIVLTILFGLTQVGLGFIFGFINNWNHGHKRHAISKIFSLLTLIFGTIAIAGAFFSVVSGTVTIATTVIAIACLIGIVAANPGEAVEITSLITHPLSYLRIMGFGLASVIIAFVIDQAFTPHLGAGIEGILIFIVYLIIFSVLHFLNMILGIFEGAVQSARLNFVEFFTKFYAGGGIKFNPFAYRRVHTEE